MDDGDVSGDRQGDGVALAGSFPDSPPPPAPPRGRSRPARPAGPAAGAPGPLPAAGRAGPRPATALAPGSRARPSARLYLSRCCPRGVHIMPRNSTPRAAGPSACSPRMVGFTSSSASRSWSWGRRNGRGPAKRPCRRRRGTLSPLRACLLRSWQGQHRAGGVVPAPMSTSTCRDTPMPMRGFSQHHRAGGVAGPPPTARAGSPGLHPCGRPAPPPSPPPGRWPSGRWGSRTASPGWPPPPAPAGESGAGGTGDPVRTESLANALLPSRRAVAASWPTRSLPGAGRPRPPHQRRLGPHHRQVRALLPGPGCDARDVPGLQRTQAPSWAMASLPRAADRSTWVLPPLSFRARACHGRRSR